ncbi:ABC transporter transmembrane domain-containing protein [Bradyrhizobium iriomotense]|uniref:Toxin ABC transporter n=1 Tax=Bradyrhizobium iriomotense TaxID=441950 RepID=A0ABQ6ASA1_9BRAD|nr:ABC transporter transmembrane domain-containing protein [Bradyrhizobium iriomotense]GLR83500.1 toxin ABC transporter [Bradyrhizobium iriomotense]
MLSQVAETRPMSVTVLSTAASICAHLLALAVPLALLQTYDRILPNEAYSTTFVLALGVSVAIVLEALLRYGRSVLFAYVGEAFESRVTLLELDHLMRANGKAVQAYGVPALSDAVRAVGQVRDFWSGNAAAALHELPFLAIYIGLIAYIASWLALVPIVLTIVALIAALLVTRATRKTMHDLEAAEAERRNLAWGIFGGLVEVKAMAAEPMLTRRYRDVVARVMAAEARIEDQLALIRENGALLSQIATVAVVTIGAFMVVGGHLTTGGLAACTLLAGRSIGPAMGAFVYLSRLSYRREAERKIESVLRLPQARLWRDSGRQIFRGGQIELSGSALRDGSVAIPRGNAVHVDAVDPLAATALLEAVARLDDSLDVHVTYDGMPGSSFENRSFRDGIAMVSCHTNLIGGTLLDNMTLFSPQYNADAIELMQRLGLNAFVDGLKQGLMTMVGPAGAEIVSPGIAVRIGLIRALVRRPAVLCLDEVGVALDLGGMRRLVETLKEIKGRTTIFLVSQDPSLLEIADQTIRLRGEETQT